MKLLIITQKVDRDDSVLGTYHRWIEEFAKNCEKVSVICLEEGHHNLPKNVRIYSLGKEGGRSRLKYITNFYRYLWRLRGDYDSVFVHMNEEYVLLAGWWWRLQAKRVALFRNHIQGTWQTPIAVWLSNVVFCTSPHSYTAKFRKTKIVPAGIDLDKFRLRAEPHRLPRSILSMGRIDPVKNVDVLIKALKLLSDRGVNVKATIVGDPGSRDARYYHDLMLAAAPLVESKVLEFKKALPNTRTPEMYHTHEVFVNMTNSGSFDKTILSAMASGMLVVLCNRSFSGVVPPDLFFQEGDASDLADKLAWAVSLPRPEQARMANNLKLYVESNHSLEATIRSVLSAIKAI